MAVAKTSEATKLILNFIVENWGDIEFTKEDAFQIWGGSTAAKVSELNQTQLLQFALIEIYRQRDELAHIIETVQNMPLPNRKDRRALEKQTGIKVPGREN